MHRGTGSSQQTRGLAVFCVHVCLLYVWFVCVLFVPSVLWYCWLGLLTCENRLPYNLYCVGGQCSIQSNPMQSNPVVKKQRQRLHDKSQIRSIWVCREIIPWKSCASCISGNPRRPLPCLFCLDSLCLNASQNLCTLYMLPLYCNLTIF